MGSPTSSGHRGNAIDETSSLAGSLDYSASSSVQSADSSSYVEIFKHIDIDLKDYTDPEIKAFMATQTRAASDGGVLTGHHSNNGKRTGRGAETMEDQAHVTPAVAMWNQRVEDRHQQQQAKQKKMPQFNKYSKDDNDNRMGNIHGDFQDLGQNILNTIAGRDTEENPYHSPHNSAPSSPRAASRGHTTPSTSIKTKRTNALPGANPISRMSSRHSKSSSDGSFDTPTPSSPSVPSHPRISPPSGRKGGGHHQRDNNKVVTETFYAEPWMCGFTDAFTDSLNIEGFDGLENNPFRK